MSEAILLLGYLLVIFALPFGIAFILRIYANKGNDSWEAEPSGTSKSYDFSSANNTGKSNNNKKNSRRTYEYSSKHTYRPWETEKKNIFKKKEGAYISMDLSLYKAALSVIALFSWVIRKDGSIGDQEMKVALAYFDRHPIYNDILLYSPKNEGNDPISNSSHSHMGDCMELLEYYNSCPILLRYEKCCQYIREAGIYYTAALDLVKALCQVAYSSDGVINSEAEILSGIAQKLGIRREGWLNLMRMYGIGKNTNQKGKDESSKQNDGRKSDNAHKQEKERSDEQQRNQKKSSTFGYKLTQAYNKLGILTTASESEIKDAYRTLVKKYHPDRLSPEATNQERRISTDKFRQVQEAYDYICLERGM